jgi:hypothetical protein
MKMGSLRFGRKTSSGETVALFFGISYHLRAQHVTNSVNIQKHPNVQQRGFS